MSRLTAILIMGVALALVFPAMSTTVIAQSEHATTRSMEIAATGSNNTTTPIKHVVNVFMENHSFDNLFGAYPASRENGTLVAGRNLSIPLNLIGHGSVLNNLSAVPNGQFTTANPIEGWVPYHQDWNNGAMNGFLTGSGKQALTYYTSAQLAPEWALAEQYGLGDNFYAEQIGESTPNHLYYLTGFAPVHNDYGPPPYIPFSQSIMGELAHYNVSWTFYLQRSTPSIGDLNFFSGSGAYGHNVKSWSDFASDVANGTLPAASWLYSQGPGNYSQGPPDNMLQGELWLLHVVNMIESSPLWNSTAIFITYDEFGGFYDQVSPPLFHGIQLGFRVPLIVISPYAKEDYVSHTLLTLTSLLAFLDYNWKLPALNMLVSESNIPLDFFDFNATYVNATLQRDPISFSGTYGFPDPGSMHFDLTPQMIQFNYSSHFPLVPQIAFDKLPYARNGTTQLNLTQMSAGIFVSHNSISTPIYYSYSFVVAIVIIQAALASAIIYRRRNR